MGFQRWSYLVFMFFQHRKLIIARSKLLLKLGTFYWPRKEKKQMNMEEYTQKS